MPRVTYQSIQQFMTSNPVFLDGYGGSDSNTGVAGGVFSFYPNAVDLPSSLVNQVAFGVEPIFNNGNASFESIDAAFERLATMITTYMRDNSGHPVKSDYTGVSAQLAQAPARAPGVLHVSRTFVVVQWLWLILPLLVLLIVMLYLIAAIVQGGVKDRAGNTQAHLWKSNAIVPLVIGHQSQLQGSLAALDGPGEMRTLKKKGLKLVAVRGGWTFVETNEIGAR